MIQTCLALAALLVCSLPRATSASLCPQDVISYWRLGESSAPYVNEINGQAGSCTSCPVHPFNGTCTNCPTAVSSGAIASDGAQLFDGTDDGISVASNAIYSWSETDSFSIALWMKKGANSGTEVLIARRDAANQTRWKVELLGSGQAKFSLRASNGQEASVTGSKILDNDVWHHIVAIRNGATDDITLCVDGLSETQTTFDFTTGFTSDADLTIGWIDEGDNDRYSGVMDEVAIYSSVLPDEDIAAQYYLSRSYCSLADNPIGIMPLGDSITMDNKQPFGTSGNSYRKPLWDDLNANLFWADFLGDQQGFTSDFDNDHQGIAGIRDDEVAANVIGYLNWVRDNQLPAEVILLHIGTNGITELDGESPDDVEDILTNIDSWNNSAGQRITVVLARIINTVVGYSQVTNFNINIQNMADQRIADGDKIIIVDMENDTGLDYRLKSDGGDFVDNLHPHDSGYVKMSDEWYAKLNAFLPMTVPPQITSSPVDEAFQGFTYSYDVQATGTPDAVFSLATAPSGMIINPQTGLIQWTPTQVGSENVVVQAQNTDTEWGTTDQSFTITVTQNNPPQITSLAPTANVKVGDLFTYQAVAIDGDGDPLTWSIDFGPSGMSIDSGTGVVTWTPTAADVGTAISTIKVSDGKNNEATQSFSITVSSSSSGSDGGGGCYIESLR